MQTHWKAIADKQQYQSIQRQREEQIIKQKLKEAYMQQLSNQLKMNEELRKRDKSLEKWQEKQLIGQSVQQQKKQIQTEMMRLRSINQKEERIQMQNEMIERRKRDQAAYVRKVENQIELKGIQQTKRIAQIKRLEELRKKEQARRQLLESIDRNKEYRSLSNRYEKQFQKQILEEGQTRKLQDQIERQRFYHQLRQRSKKVDYGSHNSFQDKHNKTLLQRKKEEWQTYKDSIQMQQKMKQTEQQARMNKMVVENQYRQELRRQIEQRSKSSKQKAFFDLQTDRKTINYSQQISDRAYQQQRDRQQHQKKLLGNYLLFQADQKSKERSVAEQMKDHEVKMNIDILSNQNNINSIDTYHLDPYRKRQLEVIQKSLNPSKLNTIDYAQNSRLTYFANRGINLIK